MSYVKLVEPPLAEPHERWCERSVGEIIAYLLLDYSLDKMPFLSARKQAVRQKIYLKALEIRKCRRSYFIENHLEQEVNPMYLASLLENIKYGILP